MANDCESRLVVIRSAAEKETGPLLVKSQLVKSEPSSFSSSSSSISSAVSDGSKRKSMVAHLGHRFGPVIAVIDDEGELHIHPSISRDDRLILLDSVNSQQREIILREAPHPRDLAYKRKALLSVSMAYTPLLAQHEMENDPQLHIYLSGNVARGVTIVKDLDEEKTNRLNLKLELTLTRPTVPYDCLLNVQAYAQYQNEMKQMCLNQCGYASVPLCLALTSRESYEQPLLVNNSETPERSKKGKLAVKIESFVFEDDGTPVPTEGDVPSFQQIENELKKAEEYARKYIHENRKLCYSQVPASSNSIERVTVFTFATQSHGYVPGSYFDVFRIPLSRVEFTLNALEIGRERSHLVDRDSETSPDRSLLEFFRKSSRRALLKVVMWALCVYVTSCTYITDEVDHNLRSKTKKWLKKLVELMESFDNMITRDSGDCEDFTKAILVFLHSLKRDYGMRASIDAEAKSDADELMLRMTDLLNGFVFCSGLCGVSSASLDEQKMKRNGNVSSVELNGHEAVFAIPRATFKKAVVRHDPNSPIAIYMQNESKQYPRYYREDDIIYPLEGTGVLNPEPMNKSEKEKALEDEIHEFSERKDYQAMRDSRALFTYNPSGDNNFYKMFITLMTPEFMLLRGIPIVEFVLYERNQLRSNYRHGAHIGKRGVWFDELLNINENDHICIINCPEFSPQLEAACATLTKDNVPLWKPFATIAETPKEWKYRETTLGGPVVPSADQKAGERVNYFLPAHLMDDKRMNELKWIADACSCVLNCRLESVRQNPNGHKVGNFVISFTRKPKGNNKK